MQTSKPESSLSDFQLVVRNVCREIAAGKGDLAVTYAAVEGGCRLRMNTARPWFPRRCCEAAELAGWPVWTSAPDEAMRPY